MAAERAGETSGRAMATEQRLDARFDYLTRQLRVLGHAKELVP